MQRAHRPEELRELVRAARKDGARVGFVPTMGCLHAGHASLMRAAARDCRAVVASVYVNPTQFGPNEDFDAYPRQLEADAELSREAGATILYAPRDEAMYPEGFSTFVDQELLSVPLCGQGRPGHFRGVCTIVTKLLNQVGPDIAYFGQKDAQQALVIRRMVRDLDLPVEIRICPIVREPDGLAMSSRNRYLSGEDRGRALTLSKALTAVRRSFEAGERRVDSLIAAGKAVFRDAPGVSLEYLEVVEAQALTRIASVRGICLVAVAAKVGPARLIDNLVLDGDTGKVREAL